MLDVGVASRTTCFQRGSLDYGMWTLRVKRLGNDEELLAEGKDECACNMIPKP